MNAAARGQITFNEAQKGEDTFYLRLSPSTLAMSNEQTAEDKAAVPQKQWYEKYHTSLRLMRGDTNVSGSITRIQVYNEGGVLVYDNTLSSQPTNPDIIITGQLITAVNPMTGVGEEYWRFRFTKFNATAPCAGQFEFRVTASILAEEGSTEYIPFADYITLSYAVEDNELLLGLEYLRNATSDGRVTTEGGLILSSAIALGEWDNNTFVPWAGMSGIYDEDLADPGKSIAAWYGGDIIDYESLTAAQKLDPTIRYAQSLFRMDGSGYLAGGGISWDDDGNLIIAGGVKMMDSQGRQVTVGGVADLSDLFELRNIGTAQSPVWAIHALNNYPIYSDSWISALGAGSSGGSGGGGGADLSDVWDSLMTNDIGDDYYNSKIDIGHIPAFTVSQSGTGNVVSGLSYSNGVFTLTKTQVSTALADLTGADDLRAIEALTGTGLLKRTGNNQWELDSTTYLSSANAYIVGNTIHLGQYSELTVLTEHQPIFSLTVNNAAGDAITTYNPASDTATLNLTAASVGLGNVQNINVTTWATITGSTDKTITLGGSSVTIPAWAMSLNTLESSLDQVYHKKFGDANTAFTASTLTVAQTATINGAAIVGNNNFTNAKVYFGSTGSYLELTNVGTSQNPSYALHSNLPFFSDSWISALGEGEGGSSGGGGGVDNHVLISEEDFEEMTTFDDGKIYLVYEDEES